MVVQAPVRLRGILRGKLRGRLRGGFGAFYKLHADSLLYLQAVVILSERTMSV